MLFKKLSLILIFVVLIFGLTGCGTDKDKDAVNKTVTDFVNASAQNDWAGALQQTTGDQMDKLMPLIPALGNSPAKYEIKKLEVTDTQINKLNAVVKAHVEKNITIDKYGNISDSRDMLFELSKNSNNQWKIYRMSTISTPQN